ncbi:MAG: Uncharacterized protein FD123_2714 [Bacteroidetes bacterium]|nr:MAG: Uncharacterized protein FD123_2714 [Bacteroidota bacterium]
MMNRQYISLLALIGMIAAPMIFQKCGPAPAPPLPPNIQDMCFCPDSAKKDSFCSMIPKIIAIPDSLVNEGYRAGFDSLRQPYFDIFSWQSFVALNWPADGNGNPIPGAFSKDYTSPRVWEHYADPDTVFTKPVSFVPPAVRSGAAANKKILYMTSKFSNADSLKFDNPSLLVESDGNALIDKNLNYAVFEERINPDELTYINKNNLNTQAGQVKWIDSLGHTVSLPQGSKKNNTTGAIEIKASWRILIRGTDSMATYYHQPAIIYIDSAYTTNGKPLTVEAEVGLVGLHIIHKTEQLFGQFMVWSTFEHIDNVPDNLQKDQTAPPRKEYSFYDPNCIGCPVNTPPAPKSGDKVVKWSPTPPYAQDYATTVQGEQGGKSFGTQVVRLYPVYYYTELVNDVWRDKLKGTVWENYRLIGSQWGGKVDGPPFDTVNAPQFLANTTMETYIQGNASCINCHKFAVIAGQKPKAATKYNSDFSFLFHHATVKSQAILPKKDSTVTKGK